MKAPSHLTAKLLIFGTIFAAVLLWVALDFPCLFRTVTGIPCIGCGLSRAWLAALRLDFAAAFQYHPMFWSIPILALLAFFDGRLLSKPGHNKFLLAVLSGGFFVCYAIRIVGYLSGTFAF